ncbi:sigma-54-dependent Fis family transcriptional regulator [Anaeromicrobium sediminis]|uniref:Stage 0 sporulation protein A homolog n=2 Tax=Anaeromicrobium sediminis TaxID=1478221 RepID=A0A267MP78_9FIRM|nr:sigma-54-dependent Fis family transcriptional regulator [Anaeromicrobium sediminis]
MNILVVDDEIEYRQVLKIILDKRGYDTDTAANGEEALRMIKKKNYDLILTDLLMDKMDGVELLKRVKKINENIQVIIITGYGTIENAVEAIKKGAYNYFVKSHAPGILLKDIKKIKEMLLSKKKDKHLNEGFILDSKSEKFKECIHIAKKAADSNANILILGESGVGKEVIANYIHVCSSREKEKFMPINCSAFAESLLESELFGHEKGAFTGAIERRIGKLESVKGGTLFLDEVGDISLNTQVKLLRVLENRRIERIGSNNSIDVNFGLISATNKNISDEIFRGSFREDFFYRISTITIEIPPLRERREDIINLIDFFLNKSKLKYNKEIDHVEDGVMNFLRDYHYPGNIRELKNIIEMLVVLSEGGYVLEKYLPKDKNENRHSLQKINIIKPLKEMRNEIEAEYIKKVLDICENNISKAARELKISRRQLFNKVTEYNLK